MIKRVIDAMMAGDYKAMAECFAPKCRYFDYCPYTGDMQNFHLYGRPSIEMFFRNRFTFRSLSVFDAEIENDSSANYVVSYGGKYMHVEARIESADEDGLIQEMTVRPA